MNILSLKRLGLMEKEISPIIDPRYIWRSGPGPKLELFPKVVKGIEYSD